MAKITFMGAGQLRLCQERAGRRILSPVLQDSTIALYDIDPVRLEDSRLMLTNINNNHGGKATIEAYLGVEQRKDALRGADFVINAIQVGLYEPCTVTDFEVPKKYGLRQTIGDTLGIGGIFRALRTIPVMMDFVEDMMQVCPNAWFLNYTNPMAMLTGALLRPPPSSWSALPQRPGLRLRPAEGPGMEYDDTIQWKIAGINHMAWLLEITKDGKDLYPEIKRRALARTEKHSDMVRYEIMRQVRLLCH